jgi:uncharacterized protein (DUF2141 family)
MRLPGLCALPASVAALLTLVPARAETPADLTIHVENVSPRGGILRLGVYDESRYPDDESKPVAFADVKALPGRTTITLHGIAPGTYAIEAFQDINANGRMDMTLVGLPQEPFGFSRDVHPHLGKPDFRLVKFSLVPGQNVQTLHLQTSISLLP